MSLENPRSPVELTRLLFDIFNRHGSDGSNWVDFCADDCVYIGPGGGKAHGIDEIRRVTQASEVAFPDEKVELIHCVGNDTVSLVSMWDSGTHLGHFGPMPPTGRTFRQRAVSQFTWRDGEVVEWVDYLDLYTWFFVQLGWDRMPDQFWRKEQS